MESCNNGFFNGGPLVRAKCNTSRQVSLVPRWVLPTVAFVALAWSGWVLCVVMFALENIAARTYPAWFPPCASTFYANSHMTRVLTHRGCSGGQGKLYESTGRYGASTLRRVDPETGNVEQRVDIDPNLFGEGLARVDDQLIMLTWKAQLAFVFGLDRLTSAARSGIAVRGGGFAMTVRNWS